jgi:hypothetical protein
MAATVEYLQLEGCCCLEENGLHAIQILQACKMSGCVASSEYMDAALPSVQSQQPPEVWIALVWHIL